MNFISCFSAIVLAALVLINLGSQALTKGKALQTNVDSMASVPAQLKKRPGPNNGPVIGTKRCAGKARFSSLNI